VHEGVDAVALPKGTVDDELAHVAVRAEYGDVHADSVRSALNGSSGVSGRTEIFMLAGSSYVQRPEPRLDDLRSDAVHMRRTQQNRHSSEVPL